VTLLVAGLIMCGCDYAEVKGLNADAIVQTVPAMIQHNVAVRTAMEAAWRGDADAVADLRLHLFKLVHATAAVMKDIPRMRKKTIENLQTPDKEQILRAAWCCAYWSGNELTTNLDRFGFKLSGPIFTSSDM
jgi:hypothetical protein